ncbi:D-Ala-D-Ala carboxypeptidase family metallohydrolase [Heliobacterium chlorum]|nr:D-Ala-D-Ala carboxypeptidase family metallohydrolase [Heliobacterium chlorum]
MNHFTKKSNFMRFGLFLCMFFSLALFSAVILPGQAQAAYSWSRTLQVGDQGSDVKELQIRVAGFAADWPSNSYVDADGVFGEQTKAAVVRFQRAYGLTADGVVGPQTEQALNNLEDSDHSTKHFDWNEFYSQDGSQFSGGMVDAATVKENVRRMMWKLEALRKKAGDQPVIINSGYRSVSHNTAVSGSADQSQHQYGIAADVAVVGQSASKVSTLAKTCGFSGIIIHDDFVHLDNRIEYNYGATFWWWE